MTEKIKEWTRRMRLQEWMSITMRRINMKSNIRTLDINMIPQVMTWMKTWIQMSNV